MKLGILCAMERELHPFLGMIIDVRTSQRRLLTVYEGMIDGIPVAALVCGMGKVNAALGAQLLIDLFHCSAIVNSGTAGGLSEELELIDVVVCTECAHHDMDAHILTEHHPHLSSAWLPSDPQLLNLAERAAQDMPGRVFFGRMATGDQFIAHERREEINRLFAPLSVDMETAAAAQACHANGIPFIAVRAITDTARHIGPENASSNCARASQISADFVRRMLRLMNQP